MSARGLSGLPLSIALVATLGGQLDAQTNVQQKIRYGTILDMEQTTVEVQTSGSGAQVGATVGAVAGYALADGRDRWLGALVGGVLGSAGGRAVEKRARKKKGWQLIILLEGTREEIGVQVKGKKKPEYDVGDRVRLLSAGGETKVTRAGE